MHLWPYQSGSESSQFFFFRFFATVNLLILQSVEQQWINLFKVCIHKENLNFSGLNAWTAVWWLKGRHLQLALAGGRQSTVTCSSAQVLTPRSILGLLMGQKEGWAFVCHREGFSKAGPVLSSSHRKPKKEEVKGHDAGQNGLNLVNIRGYSF